MNKKNTMEGKNIVSASASNRFFAFLIDIFFVYLLRFLYVNISIQFWLKQPIQLFMSKYKMLYGNFDLTKITAIELYYFLNSSLFKQLVIFVIGAFLVSVAYNVIFLSTKWSATIGQKLLGLYVVSKNGEKIKIYQIIIRSFAVVLPWFFIFLVLFYKFISDITATEIIDKTLFIISILIFASWYDLAFFTRNKLIFHDILSGTRVIFKDKERYTNETHGLWTGLFPNFKDMYINLRDFTKSQISKANELKTQYKNQKNTRKSKK